MALSLRLPLVRNAVSLKFAFFVAAIFGGALTALLVVQRVQRQSLGEVLASEGRERSAMMLPVIELTGQSLRHFTSDYAEWDSMVDFVQRPRRRWASVNLDPALESFNLTALWVLRPDGSIAYTTRRPAMGATPFPLSDSARPRVLASPPETTFFAQSPDGLLEFCLAAITPSDGNNPGDPARGWLLAARVWDRAQLKLLGEIVQCEVSLAAPDRPLPASTPNRLNLQYPLKDVDGRVAANLVFVVHSGELEIVSQYQGLEFGLFAATCLLVGAVMLFFMYRAFIRPLSLIGASLARRDTASILPLLSRRDELGHVAQLVQTSFEQHTELERMLAERIRLGRELHDGVIQTAYAAGMNLAAARSILRDQPAAAEQILDDTHRELNVTIRDLRDFISGLESEPLEERTFAQAMDSIIALMRGARPVSHHLALDEDLAACFTSLQRLHLLQITREAVSNSIRHGSAQHIRIKLERVAADAVLEIVDDGSGLNAGSNPDGGRGLANISARARELGGTLQLDSPATGGVCLRLVLPVAALPAAPLVTQ